MSKASAPLIICPFSFFGDEIAGKTANEVALNLAAATRIAVSWHRKPIRECPDLHAAFRGLKAQLTPEARLALQWTTRIYARYQPDTQCKKAA